MHGSGGWCSARIVPCGAGSASSSASQSSCAPEREPQWKPGYGRVEGDHAEPVHVVDAVDGLRAADLAEQHTPEGGAIVVVAHAPDHLRAEAAGGRLDDPLQLPVGARLAEVREVPGEDDRLRPRARGLEVGEDALQRDVGADRSVELPLVRQQVRVAEVQQEVVGAGVLRRPHGLDVAGTASGRHRGPALSSPEEVPHRTYRDPSRTGRGVGPPMTVA